MKWSRKPRSLRLTRRSPRRFERSERLERGRAIALRVRREANRAVAEGFERLAQVVPAVCAHVADVLEVEFERDDFAAAARLVKHWNIAACARIIATSACRSIVLVRLGCKITSAPMPVRVRSVSGNHMS
jgi:hypothetical protein